MESLHLIAPDMICLLENIVRSLCNLIWKNLLRLSHMSYIFGNASDNLIDGGLGDDIIFGGDGDDVIIGGEGDDIITGGAGDDVIRGDTVTDQDAALSYFAELTNFDDSQLSIDNSGMGTGGDDVILGGDGIDDIDSGDGNNLVSSGRLDLDDDGETDLEIVESFMEDNNIDNKDIFDNDEWV